MATLGCGTLTSLLPYELEVLFHDFIVLQDLLWLVNMSVFLKSEFVELLQLFTPMMFIFCISLLDSCCKSDIVALIYILSLLCKCCVFLDYAFLTFSANVWKNVPFFYFQIC